MTDKKNSDNFDFRITSNFEYKNPNSIGHVNLEVRNGFYLEARDENEALMRYLLEEAKVGSDKVNLLQMIHGFTVERVSYDEAKGDYGFDAMWSYNFLFGLMEFNDRSGLKQNLRMMSVFANEFQSSYEIDKYDMNLELFRIKLVPTKVTRSV